MSTTGHTSNLQFSDYLLQSAEGAQQGDPLGPLYFCLAFKELLESVRSELVLGYLDDVVMGGEAMCLLKDFLNLEAAGKKSALS